MERQETAVAAPHDASPAQPVLRLKASVKGLHAVPHVLVANPSGQAKEGLVAVAHAAPVVHQQQGVPKRDKELLVKDPLGRVRAVGATVGDQDDGILGGTRRGACRPDQDRVKVALVLADGHGAPALWHGGLKARALARDLPPHPPRSRVQLGLWWRPRRGRGHHQLALARPDQEVAPVLAPGDQPARPCVQLDRGNGRGAPVLGLEVDLI
mmetsp:Transcript_10360/g.35748  ORF Transcript_10360/g.35748 Transcript_10360/m.35748 type:complete len:211 (-) Transcript_10360:1541-2173(-)